MPLPQLSSVRGGALLRLMTRDGRLDPGLAPPVAGPVVNAEAGEQTPPKEIERMRAIAAGKAEAGSSPFM